MKSLKLKLSKFAVFAFIGAFSFGLSLSCVLSNNRSAKSVYAADTEPDGTWTLSNGSLSFQYTDWQTNGYVTETNQTMVYGHGDGTFDISYELLGSPPGATTAGTELIAEKTIQLTGGYWTPSETGGYGTVSGYPVDVNGLDSDQMITLNINVQYSGTMNEQNSGTGTTEPDGTWTLSNGSLSFQFTDWQTNGYVTETNQTMVYGHGDGTFDISYELLGSPPGATSAGTELIAEKTIQLTRGYWTPGDTGYGTVTGYPVDVNGLDSGEMITLNINVQYSGTMNEQNSGAGTTEPDGTWTLSNGSLSFQFTDWQTNGYVTETNQTMVYGHGDGTFDISYELLGSPPGATSAGTELIAEKTIQLTRGYWTPGDTGYGTVTGYPVDVNGLDSGEMITLNINVQYSGNMNEQGSGGGDDETGTVIYYDASVGFYYGTTERVVLTVTRVDFTGSENFENGTATVYLTGDDVQYSTTMSNVSLDPAPTNPSGGNYTGTIFGYIDESQCSVNYHPLESVPLNYEVEATPEPPALSALEWYFDTDMGYFATNLYNDGYYSFALSTQINSVIYDRANSTVTAYCTIDSREGNMPEEYYEAEMTFAYTFESSGLVENVWHFYNAVCEATVEQTESLYFSVDVVSFRQIGWYFDEDLHYYVEEGVEASWNILHAEYRTEDSRNELILYMQVLYNDEYFSDVIQINNPNFDDTPYRGQTTLGTGVNGWSDKLQQNISIMVNYVPFGYYANGWSYDPYFNQLVYINADDIDMKYQLTSASSNEGSYLLTYTCDGDSQSITVMEAVYQDEMLTGEVVLVENSDPITINVSVPQSIIDGGTTSTYEYHICFDGNGATRGSMDDDVFTKDSYSFDYPLPDCGYEKDGYTFDGWATVAVDPVIKFQPGQTSNVRSVDQENPTYTFYATWKKTNFTITFYPNGGSGTMEPIIVANGAREVVPYCEFDYPGYEFVCWAVGSPTSSMKVTPDGQYSVTVTQDYDLYAVWESNTPVEGHWDMENGSLVWIEDKTYYPEFTYAKIIENPEPSQRMCIAETTINSETKTLSIGDPEVSETQDGTIIFGYCYDVQTRVEIIILGTVDVVPYETDEPGWNYKDGALYWWSSTQGYCEVGLLTAIKCVDESGNPLYFELKYVVYDTVGSDAQDEHIETVKLIEFSINPEPNLDEEKSGIVSGYFELIAQRVEIEIWEYETKTIQTDKGTITPEQQDEINNLLPESSDPDKQARVEESMQELSQEAAQDILYAVNASQSDIEDEFQKALADGVPEEEALAVKQEKIETVQIITEAAVVVGASSAKAEEEAQVVEQVLPSNHGLQEDLGKTLDDFYQKQMNYLLGKETVPESKTLTRGIHRAPEANGKKIDLDNVSQEEYKKMIDFVDVSVKDMKDAALQIRKCSGTEMKQVINDYIQTVKISVFRDFNPEEANEEFVAQAYQSIMLTMQQQVIDALEKDHQPSNNQEKEAQYQETLAAVKDYDTFEEIVIEVLRLKYVSLTNEEIDIEIFRGMYMNIFRAWALNDESLNPTGITLEELTTATIESQTTKARKMTFNATFTKEENIFLIVMASAAVATAVGGITATVLLKRKKRGLNK